MSRGAMESETDVKFLYTHRTLGIFYLITAIVCTGLVYYFAPEGWGIIKIVVVGQATAALAYLMTFINHIIMY